jgi:hypothetical protein
MKQKRWKLLLTVLILVAVLITVFAVTGVFASLGDTTGVITVREGSVSCKVDRDYTITNTGTVPVLIRAKVVVNWVDDEGHILGVKPTGANVSIGAPSGWTHFPSNAPIQEGYWFFNGTVEPGQKLPFIGAVSPEGGNVKITVLTEAIQAVPQEAVAEAWNMRYSNGVWKEQ